MIVQGDGAGGGNLPALSAFRPAQTRTCRRPARSSRVALPEHCRRAGALRDARRGRSLRSEATRKRRRNRLRQAHRRAVGRRRLMGTFGQISNAHKRAEAAPSSLFLHRPAMPTPSGRQEKQATFPTRRQQPTAGEDMKTKSRRRYSHRLVCFSALCAQFAPLPMRPDGNDALAEDVTPTEAPEITAKTRRAWKKSLMRILASLLGSDGKSGRKSGRPYGGRI